MSANTQKRHARVEYACLIFEDGPKILFIHRQNTGYSDGMLGFPGGHVEAKQTVLQAMVCEAREEIGIEITPEELKLVHIQSTFDETGVPCTGFYFRAQIGKHQPFNAEPEKCVTLVWRDISDVLNRKSDLQPPLTPKIPGIIEAVTRGISYSETTHQTQG